MTSILRTASYVRSHTPSQRETDMTLQSILDDPDLDRDGGERIWELLETPQTIETLCRALHVEAITETPASDRAVESLLVKLYEHDLIEVAADS
jgi:hypothetical protein